MTRDAIVWRVLEQWACRPFTYQDDCGRFAAAMVEALTGHNPLAGAKYRTKRQAYRIIRRRGSLRRAVVDYLGPANTTAPISGDIALTVDSGGRELLGVVYGDSIAVRTAAGLTDWPLSRGLAFWGVIQCRK